MDVPLLRKLTWKSVLGFGKYADMSIRQIYELNHTAYLRWVYYNASNITFIDEILGLIRIDNEYKIIKPGTNKELGDKIDSENIEKMRSCIIKPHADRKLLIGSKIHQRQFLHSDSRYFSKAMMQNRNQGRK